MFDFLQAYSIEAVAALVAALAALSILDDAIADWVRRIPGVGPLLAPLARRLSARFRDWMRTRVPRSAEDAVTEAEGALGPKLGVAKKARAVATLDTKEPGLRQAELDKEIEAALARLIGDAALREPATPTTAPNTPARHGVQEGLR